MRRCHCTVAGRGGTTSCPCPVQPCPVSCFPSYLHDDASLLFERRKALQALQTRPSGGRGKEKSGSPWAVAVRSERYLSDCGRQCWGGCLSQCAQVAFVGGRAVALVKRLAGARS